jgi:hypothetical protein
MRPNEAATARGEVFFRGTWMTWQAQERIVADEQRRREELAAARKERDEQRRQARLTAAAINAPTLYPETYVSGYYRSPWYNPYGGWHQPGYRPIAVFNPGIRPPVCPPVVGWHVGGSGGGSNHAWSFSWGGSSGGHSIR